MKVTKSVCDVCEETVVYLSGDLTWVHLGIPVLPHKPQPRDVELEVP